MDDELDLSCLTRDERLAVQYNRNVQLAERYGSRIPVPPFAGGEMKALLKSAGTKIPQGFMDRFVCGLEKEKPRPEKGTGRGRGGEYRGRPGGRTGRGR